MATELIDEMKGNMDKSLKSLQKDLVKMRTGRASPTLVEGVQVDYYGTKVPVNQVANITTPDAKTIQITPWEANMAGPIEKAIAAANLGFNPQNDGKILRIPMPALTEERRKEMVKTVRRTGEDAKVAIRNHRRDTNESLKKKEKDKEISEDDLKKALDVVQKETDANVKNVDSLIETKEKEILTI